MLQQAALASATADIASPIPAHLLAQEVAALPASARLMRVGDFEVLCSASAAIPQLMLEIGRLREWAFRLVGEGTGKARDIDAFDAAYQQLFVWHHGQQCVLGAYRLGFTQEIAAAQGVAGLYTHTLFDFDERLLAQLGPSMEMGRSFVHPEWQGSSRALRLLWAGIALLLERNPQIRNLFGPVSISASYSALGRSLMMTALQLHHMDAALKPLIQARNAPGALDAAASPRLHQRITEMGAGLGDPSRLSRALKLIERGMGLPMLIKHYIELRGRFAAFSVDAAFNQTLDGLVFVRVEDIPVRFRARLTSGK